MAIVQYYLRTVREAWSGLLEHGNRKVKSLARIICHTSGGEAWLLISKRERIHSLFDYGDVLPNGIILRRFPALRRQA